MDGSGTASVARASTGGLGGEPSPGLLGLLKSLDEQIGELDQAAERAVKETKARLLMTQPGVGPITSLAFAVTIGDASRFSVASRWPAISG